MIAQIKNRNYKFIIYMDDLSFEEFEIEYKYLKAVIEGGLEKKPENILIYATSNRRHLIKETFRDNEDGMTDDLHSNDTDSGKAFPCIHGLVSRFTSVRRIKSSFRKLSVSSGEPKRHVTMPEEDAAL